MKNGTTERELGFAIYEFKGLTAETRRKKERNRRPEGQARRASIHG